MTESDLPKPAIPAGVDPREAVNAARATAASVSNVQLTPGEDISGIPTNWSAGQVILDDFVVERELGAGGMGKVYLLRSRSTGLPFAVKRAFLRSKDSRRDFFAELQTWIDLPEHPHLVACRFFRTVGDEVVIFAECLEGGSLADWIQDRRLKSLEQILDVAIQLAWGLSAAHKLGLVHQDVKPGNVLLTPDGTVKVTDFGLARFRGAGPGALSGGGGTQRYCSPEQAEVRRQAAVGVPPAKRTQLTAQTDVWSWGVSVLEMFVGEPPCPYSGTTAAESLEAYRESGAPGALQPMPELVAYALRKCFFQRPAERWASMSELAEFLKGVYPAVVGAAYWRPEPPASGSAGAAKEHTRRVLGGARWDSPLGWLKKALRAAGRDPAEADACRLPAHGTRKARAVADLAPYDQARRLFEELVGAGRKNLEEPLACLCLENALVHRAAEDLPGALARYDRAVALLDGLVRAGRGDAVAKLGAALLDRATVLREAGRRLEALACCDEAVRLFATPPGGAASADLAWAWLDKGQTHASLGEHHAALTLYDLAIGAYEQLCPAPSGELARAFAARAAALDDLGDPRAALPWYDRALAVYERLVRQEGRRDYEPTLARTYVNKAISVASTGDHRGAVTLYDQAIPLWKRLVTEEGWEALESSLALALVNKAVAVGDADGEAAALALYDEAIAVYQRLVRQEGRREEAPRLALACLNRASASVSLGAAADALPLCEEAVAILERLVNEEGRRELAPNLAGAYLGKARVLRALGRPAGAASAYDPAILILQQLLEEGRWEQGRRLADAYLGQAAAALGVGAKDAALDSYGRAVAVGEFLVAEKGDDAHRDVLLRTRARRAELLLECGHIEAGRAELMEVIPLLEADAGRAPDAGLQEVLDRAIRALQSLL